MKITLTYEQARLVVQALDWAKGFPASHPYNQKCQRIITKIEQSALYQQAGEKRRKEKQ